MQISSAADDASIEAKAAYSDAYAVLSDDSKREAYDKEQLGSNVSYPHNKELLAYQYVSMLVCAHTPVRNSAEYKDD